MTPRRPDPGGGDVHDLAGVKATDQLLDRLGRGEDVPAATADDLAVISLTVLAEDAHTPPVTRPSLDDLLQAAGLELRPATDDAPGGLHVVGEPTVAVLDHRTDGRTDDGADVGPVRSLGRAVAAQRVAYAAELVADRTGRGLRRIGVDTDTLRRVTPMMAAAVAVVALGLTGLATGLLGADPTGPGTPGSSVGVGADEVSELLDKARAASVLGRPDEAADYYLRASRLVDRLGAGHGREDLSRQVEELRVQLGLPTTEPNDGLSPSDPAETTEVSPGESAEPEPTPDESPGPSGSPDPSASPTPAPSTSAQPTSPQPSDAPATSNPTRAPTPTPSGDTGANGGSGSRQGSDVTTNG